jgi:putative YhdH/YhfP family quinone oxidoreductase
MREDELSPGDVLIRTAYSSINYKDALAAHGINRIIRRFPRIGGIDLVGKVAKSADARFKEGDAVIVHGFGVGVDHDGGHAEYARVPADWVMPLPRGLAEREVASCGVAGYTAALSIHLMELNGLAPGNGKVLVNGATGGVASVAIDMLAARGYTVTAVTGKEHERDYLMQLGASEVLPRASLEMGRKPLEKALWAGAVDSVGGEMLAWLTRTMQPDGVIASFGNAGGMELHTTVLPFILRGIRLLGINANSPMPLRRIVWERIAHDLRPRHLDAIAHAIRLEELPGAFTRLLEGKARGRTIVDMSK